MVIHVKDEETDILVRRLAHRRGIGITLAIKEAVSETLARDEVGSKAAGSLEERLKPLFDRWDRLPRSPVSTDKAFFDEAWGE